MRAALPLLALCAAAPAAAVPAVNVDVTRVQARTDRRYLSIAEDSSSLALMDKWTAFDRLRSDANTTKLVAAFAPAYMRIGGTMCDCVKYDMTQCGEEEGVIGEGVPTPSNPTMVGRCRWEKLLKYSQATGLPLLFDLNVLSDRPGGKWDPTNAAALIDWTNRHYPGVVAGWELGNEPEGWKRNFNMTVDRAVLAEDFVTLRKVLGLDGVMVGPDYGIQGCISAGIPCPAYEELVAMIGSNGGAVNMSTYHDYNVGAADPVSGFTDPAILDRTRAAVEEAVHANALSKTPAPVWLGEGATASGGGTPGASGTYTATFIWLDKLGAIGRFGGAGLMRQSLFGGRYALIDPDTAAPRPTYWVAVLFKQLMSDSDVVLAVDGDAAANRTLRVYARCGGAPGSVVVFGTSLAGEAVTLPFAAPLTNAAGRADYILSGEQGGAGVNLNGVPMAVDATGSVLRFVGKPSQPDAELQLPALSSFFTVFSSVPGAAGVCSA